MIQPQQQSFNQKIDFPNAFEIEVYVKREDVLHTEISGNKFRKLKYNLEEAKRLGKNTLLTFGGAYSNHIAAVAAAGRDYGFKTIGVIRGDELADKFQDNPTLKKAFDDGMQFYFVTRTQYREKHHEHFLQELHEKFGAFYMVPEGGTNELGVKGCEEILTEEDTVFDFVCCAVGTGGTISGIINSLHLHQKAIGLPVLQGGFLFDEVRKYTKNKQWNLVTDYHFGGYAKINIELKQFMQQFFKKYLISLDPVYTSKVVFGVFDLIKKGYFTPHSKILIIHTGGLQGLQSNIADI
ncbi:1-aminocyclopropane-1-carboxylate deaminase/D-cysteine desulfhydrase [Flavobacterium sp. xlx-214]|uniref:1-aminocyclopropane-1-carboxylate deaminase/D-cysteine desulfhydrase n=1 Tax=unclassified Flavobacterium TaxID=196869 RepID=UPI0013D0B0AE|nr:MULTISPECIES: pyridoxal-phosphate dependent enzyme [unclassified Flavobacterium]MBA5793377.1 1-aminocyclopropane-1-carboxylate deaminase/D-cysteine desulfhydrase [Flavobacterium sp. xlx-221]QMI84062.1 1-aminocyclopropane-1-carboxylate deaminase/D-cysteine desulfhydrase [Flavobacterium sp. xlx-214]